jgi:hypothetical protein
MLLLFQQNSLHGGFKPALIRRYFVQQIGVIIALIKFYYDLPSIHCHEQISTPVFEEPYDTNACYD